MKKRVDFAVLADNRMKLKEREKNKFLDLVRELKNAVDHKSGFDTYCS